MLSPKKSANSSPNKKTALSQLPQTLREGSKSSEFNAGNLSKLSPSHRLSLTNGGGGVGGTSLQSFNNVIDRISPKTERKVKENLNFCFLQIF